MTDATPTSTLSERLSALKDAQDLLIKAGIPQDDPLHESLTDRFLETLAPKGKSHGFVIVKDSTGDISMDFYGKLFADDDSAHRALNNFISKRWNLAEEDYTVTEVFSFGAAPTL